MQSIAAIDPWCILDDLHDWKRNLSAEAKQTSRISIATKIDLPHDGRVGLRYNLVE